MLRRTLPSSPKRLSGDIPVSVILKDTDPLNPQTFRASFDGFTVLPVVYSLSPDSGLQGQTLDVTIQGEFFQNGVTTANFGPNITVDAVTVTDGDDATVTITIAPKARVERYHVSVITGTHTEDLVFGVLSAG